MDIPRPDLKRMRRLRQWVIGALVIALVAAVSIGLSRLEPAAPSVSKSSVWSDTVNRGEMLRQVSGPGKLVPSEIRWIPVETGGVVENIDVRPGAVVEPDTILIEMSNPELIQQVDEAQFALAAAEAELADTQIRLKNQQLDQRVALGAARADFESARLQAEAEKELSDQGIVSAIQSQRSQLTADQYKLRLEAEQERLDQFSDVVKAQMASQQARVDQARALYESRHKQLDALQVKAGMSGVLQELEVEEGQRVERGAGIARVARPDELRAELRIGETQARDVTIGQHVDIDTRNAIVKGRVIRIDPAVQSGTVQVDVELLGDLPRGARPDLSVDGKIELERLEDVVYMGRPAYSQPNATISIFKLTEDENYADRVTVEIGRTSVNSVEIVSGLEPGDKVILSDMSSWDDYDRIRLD